MKSVIVIIVYSMMLLSPVVCHNALVIIDVQECFLSGGSLAVKDGDQVIPLIKKIRDVHQKKFKMVIFSQDWHCKNHISFASQFSDKQPYDKVKLSYNNLGKLCMGGDVTIDMDHATQCSNVSKQITQTLWPDHCIKDITSGPTSSKISEELKPFPNIVRKGQHCQIDAYSAFNDNGNVTQTELNELLKKNDINTVFLTGLAFDYCVYYTALDAVQLGYTTYVIRDASRGVDDVTIKKVEKHLKSFSSTGRDLYLITSEDLPNIFQDSGSNHLGSTYVLLVFTSLLTINLL